MSQTKALWAQVSKKLSKEQIAAVFAKFDGNGDGKLSKEEFQQLMAAKKWSKLVWHVPLSFFTTQFLRVNVLNKREWTILTINRCISVKLYMVPGRHGNTA